MNDGGRLVAACVSNANGYYFQIYKPANLTLVVGTQQIAVSKNQIQAAMKTVGTPMLPSPRSTLDRALQASEVVGVGD